MTTIDELRRLAEAATPGPWTDHDWSVTGPSAADALAARHAVTRAWSSEPSNRLACMVAQENPGIRAVATVHGDTSANAIANAAYIAACSPAAILALLDAKEAAERDAARYRWLKSRYLAVDFSYPWRDSVISVLVFAWPIDASASAHLDATIDAALAAREGKEPA